MTFLWIEWAVKWIAECQSTVKLYDAIESTAQPDNGTAKLSLGALFYLPAITEFVKRAISQQKGHKRIPAFDTIGRKLLFVPKNGEISKINK